MNNNYSSFDISDKIRNEIQTMGVNPIKQTYGVNIPNQNKIKTGYLSRRDMLDLFGRKESVSMVYIPHFVTQCILYYSDLLMNYTRSHKMSEYKRHTRILNNICKDYYTVLRQEMPPEVYQKFLDQREEYLDLCASNLMIAYFTFGKELISKYGSIEHEDLHCYAYMISALVDCVNRYDDYVGEQIAIRTKTAGKVRRDVRLKCIQEVCDDINKSYRVDGTKQTDLAINIIVNKAKIMINKMLN